MLTYLLAAVLAAPAAPAAPAAQDPEPAAATAVPATPSLQEQERVLREKLASLRKESHETNSAAFEAWDQRVFDVEWTYGVALHKLARTSGTPDHYRRVINHFTDFIWIREGWIAALQARLYIAGAHQELKEWGQCFSNLKAARTINDPKLSKIPAIIEITTRSLIAEFRARKEFGRRRGYPIDETDLHLKRWKDLAVSDLFVALRIERAEALYVIGRRAESAKALRAIGDAALGTLAELFPGPDTSLKLADKLFDKHHFSRALLWYKRGKPGQREWLRIGQCYLNQ